MMMQCKFTRLAVALGAVILLSACSRSISHVDSQGKTAKPIFPEVSDAVRSEGSFVSRENLSNVRPGMTKAQIYELLGVPHFNEGVIKVKEWDYIFKFTKADNSVLTCQYKVLFDSDMKAQSFYFLPADCLNQLIVKRERVKPVHHDLSAESLFAFGSANLLPEGVEQIRKLAADLKTEGVNPRQIVVTGHTDRLGRKADNDKLSLARAASVKHILVGNGISESEVEIRGMGDSEPRVFCPGAKSAAVIQCLAPNRRISVDTNNL